MLITESCHCKPTLEPLDAADIQLVARIGKDPRISGRDLAKDLQRSEASISRRLSRLIEDGVIHFHAFVPPHLLGMHSVNTLFIETAQDPSVTAKALIDQRALHFLGTVAGQNLVIAQLITRSGEATTRFVDREIASRPEVVSVRVTPMMHQFTPHPMSGAAEPAASGLAHRPDKVKLDHVDRVIIAQLQRNGRATYTEMAKACGLSAAAVADRFVRLSEIGIVPVIACTAPGRFGRLLTAILRVGVKGKVGAAAEELERLTGAAFISIVGGDLQVLIEVDLEGETELQALVARLNACECVGALETMPLRAVLKDSYDWGAPD